MLLLPFTLLWEQSTVTPIEGADTAALTLTENAFFDAFIGVTDDAALSLDELAAVDVTALLEAIDTASLTLDDSAVVADVEAVAVVEANSGGYYDFEYHVARARKRRREEEEAEEEARRISDALDREIAVLLHQQSAQERQAADLKRLSSLVAKFADAKAEEAYNERVRVAMVEAAGQTAKALAKLQLELEKQFEEDEIALLLWIADQ